MSIFEPVLLSRHMMKLKLGLTTENNNQHLQEQHDLLLEKHLFLCY